MRRSGTIVPSSRVSAGHWATVASSLILPFAGEVPRDLSGHPSALAHVSDAKALIVPLLPRQGAVCLFHTAGMSSRKNELASVLRDDGDAAVVHGVRRSSVSTISSACQP